MRTCEYRQFPAVALALPNSSCDACIAVDHLVSRVYSWKDFGKEELNDIAWLTVVSVALFSDWFLLGTILA